MNDGGECLQAKALKNIVPPCLDRKDGTFIFGGKPEDMPPGLMHMIEAITKEMKKRDQKDKDFKE